MSRLVVCIAVLSVVWSSPGTADTLQRYPPPTPAQLASEVATLRKLYASEYRRTESRDLLQARLECPTLARKLKQTSLETSPENPLYYALLSETIRIATQGGKAVIAFDAIDSLSQTYAVNVAQLRLECLRHFANPNVPIGDVLQAGGLILGSIQAAADSQQLSVCLQLVDVGDEIGRRMLDKTLEQELTKAREVILLLQIQEGESGIARAVLANTPTDPEANLAMAKFHGLRRGDWETAERYAARIGEQSIRSLFVREFGFPTKTADVLQLGNDWWKFADSLDGVARLQALEIAAFHYSSIAKDAVGIDKKQIELRLATIQDKGPISVRMPLGIAIAPFSEAKAKSLQKAWASYLNKPVVRTNSIGMKLALIPPGYYVTGDSNQAHGVMLPQSFYIGVYEVTQEQYRRVTGTDPSRFKSPQNPVEQVSWNWAVEFCHKLSNLPAEKAAGYVFRLPTEAEWEYACRAGTETTFSFGDDESQLSNYAWYGSNSNNRTHPVGQKQPNAWALYDMHGNVREWCQDWYGDYPSGSITDPMGPTRGSIRVYRGGSWDNGPERCPSAFRLGDGPDDRGNTVGFRVVMVPRSLGSE